MTSGTAGCVSSSAAEQFAGDVVAAGFVGEDVEQDRPRVGQDQAQRGADLVALDVAAEVEKARRGAP